MTLGVSPGEARRDGEEEDNLERKPHHSYILSLSANGHLTRGRIVEPKAFESQQLSKEANRERGFFCNSVNFATCKTILIKNSEPRCQKTKLVSQRR